DDLVIKSIQFSIGQVKLVNTTTRISGIKKPTTGREFYSIYAVGLGKVCKTTFKCKPAAKGIKRKYLHRLVGKDCKSQARAIRRKFHLANCIALVICIETS